MKVHVRNSAGRPLPCCWNDCWSAGDDRHKVTVPHDSPKYLGERLAYIFCGPAHKDMWVAQTLANRHAAAVGPVRSPLGLVLPG